MIRKMARPASPPDLHDHIGLGHVLMRLIKAARYDNARYVSAILHTDMAELGYPAPGGWPQPGEAAPAGWDVYAAVLRWCRAHPP